MAFFDDYEVLNAFFSNNERDTVQIEVKHKETGEETSFYAAVMDDGSSAMWEELLALPGITIDKLHENTFNYIKEQQLILQQIALNAVKGSGALISKDLEDVVNYVLDFDPDDENSARKLFEIKIKLFDQPCVQNNENKELRSKLRKAKTILQLLSCYNEFVEEYENNENSIKE